MQFRLKDGANHVWNKSVSYTNSIDINNLLTAGKQYECQVKAGCNTHESGYSDLFTFELPKSLLSTFQCGLVDEDTSITNKAPKLDLWPDEVIYNGQFPVRLVEVRGGNGTFSGIGRLAVPFLANIQVLVEFKNITVNELNQVVRGEMRSIYNADSKFLLNVPLSVEEDLNDTTITTETQQPPELTQTNNFSDTIFVDGEIDSIFIENGLIVVVDTEGNRQEIEQEGDEGVLIADNQGNSYIVDKDGNVSGGSSGSGSDTSGGSAEGRDLNSLDSLVYELIFQKIEASETIIDSLKEEMQPFIKEIEDIIKSENFFPLRIRGENDLLITEGISLHITTINKPESVKLRLSQSVKSIDDARNNLIRLDIPIQKLKTAIELLNELKEGEPFKEFIESIRGVGDLPETIAKKIQYIEELLDQKISENEE